MRFRPANCVMVVERSGGAISTRMLDLAAPPKVVAPAPKASKVYPLPSWQSGSSGRGKPNRRRGR
ncbi:MAG: hypothetical protein A2754_02060 [Candidatus Magasanikbacteria bacterium RIFCSPHIGHO2_01_FULL_47_8]|uniref:Uncharacterized protein n=1 Tax=Candidatus Magasanikbacteria bacterium RIFCSPHIGHO2_01_FULL_47_8 TaxID=1798673 RepID=A0A1F6ME30_9BACT|nr:MAG: hypothetical protein A2754_02060 [Candidatus Magasanikbacteria bacterium RIFCSPHIGHO2_01_FULL_47_8]